MKSDWALSDVREKLGTDHFPSPEQGIELAIVLQANDKLSQPGNLEHEHVLQGGRERGGEGERGVRREGEREGRERGGRGGIEGERGGRDRGGEGGEEREEGREGGRGRQGREDIEWLQEVETVPNYHYQKVRPAPIAS